MKKKIINGMLMAAFLFAGTTSFVSCKDNIDDELVPVHQDLATLDNKIKELEGTVAGHTTDIQNLRTDLTKLQNRVAANKVSIDSLALITKALDKKIDSIANVVANLTVGVTIQGTVDPVLGEVRGYLTDKNTLLGFIGKNDTEIDIFPVAGDDYNVKGFETKLTEDQFDIEEALNLSGEKGEWLMAENTFGRVYVSLNPMGADATKCSFYLVPTGASFNTATGQFTETSPVKFTDAYPSTKNLTLAFGKKAGMDWEDFLNANEWDPESGLFPVTWGLDALVEADDFEGMQFDWSNFRSDYVNGWKMADLMASVREIWRNLMDGTKSKTDRGAETIARCQGLMKAIADALEYKRAELTQYAIGTVVNDTKRGLVSEAKITNVAIEPLGYMAAVNFDAVSDTYKWNFSTAKTLASKIYSKIAARFPNLGGSVTLVPAAGNTVKLFESDRVIYSLLRDALERAEADPVLQDIAQRMEVQNSDSIGYMSGITESPDVVFLDPMFPERQKSSLVKKKLQLIQQFERPCSNEGELFDAAMSCGPKKVIIKRPVKGPFLDGRKPLYSITGKVIRYDCYVL